MGRVQKGIYIYIDGWDNINDALLPSELVISDRISNEALLIRLLCGTLKIKYMMDGIELDWEQRKNYSIPGSKQNIRFQNKIIKEFFSFDHYRSIEKKSIDKYLKLNRKNHFVHEEVLSELTGAILWMEKSPIEAFVHIYRALEFMSYSFPLIYASKSMDYRGSYDHLKKFMTGDNNGELRFFKTFLKELFKDNLLFEYEFEIYFLNGNERLIKEELERVINSAYYVFDGNTMKIRFANVIDLIISIRNRYFHMLVGTGVDNFFDIHYDKREMFLAMNSAFINWLAMIYKEIAIYSVGII